MTRDAVEQLFHEHRMIAVLRTDTADAALAAGRAIIDGGGRLIEVTWTVPEAARVLAELRAGAPEDVAVGAGTVRSADDLEAALAAGAEFLISPDVFPAVIEAAAARGVFQVPGAMTPTEILAARRAGATMVKVFPIASLGGAAHVRAVRGPIPDVPLLVTGGVDLDTLDDFLDAGAAAIGLSHTLVLPEALAARDWDAIRERTRAFLKRLA